MRTVPNDIVLIWRNGVTEVRTRTPNETDYLHSSTWDIGKTHLWNLHEYIITKQRNMRTGLGTLLIRNSPTTSKLNPKFHYLCIYSWLKSGCRTSTPYHRLVSGYSLIDHRTGSSRSVNLIFISGLGSGRLRVESWINSVSVINKRKKKLISECIKTAPHSTTVQFFFNLKRRSNVIPTVYFIYIRLQ